MRCLNYLLANSRNCSEIETSEDLVHIETVVRVLRAGDQRRRRKEEIQTFAMREDKFTFSIPSTSIGFSPATLTAHFSYLRWREEGMMMML